jgi:hypothetical protein
MSDMQQPIAPEPAIVKRHSRAPIALGLVFALAAGGGIGGAVGASVAGEGDSGDLEQRLGELEAERDELARALDEAQADDEPAAAAEEPATQNEPAPPSADEPTQEPPADEPAAGTPDGSREHPFPVGTPVGNDDWEIVVGEPREAWAEILDENEFNEPPPEGTEFYIVPVTATYTGDESGLAWVDLTFEFVGTDSVTYSDYCGVIPNDLADVGELYDGGVAEGNVCIAVPAGADGLWTVSALFGDPVFLTADLSATGT